MIKYITKNNQPIGLLYAEKENGKLKIGYSLLNPEDVAETHAYNKNVKNVNAMSHQANNWLKQDGKEPIHPIEKYRPVFDRKKALELAKSRATSEINVFSLPRKVQDAVLWFVPFAFRRLKGSVTYVS